MASVATKTRFGVAGPDFGKTNPTQTFPAVATACMCRITRDPWESCDGWGVSAVLGSHQEGGRPVAADGSRGGRIEPDLSGKDPLNTFLDERYG